MKRQCIYILSIVLLVACRPGSENNTEINITAYNAYTQNVAFSYLLICDSLTRQHQNKNPIDTNNLSLSDKVAILYPESHSNYYHNTQTNPLLSKIFFYFDYDSVRNAYLTESVIIGQVLPEDTQEVKDILTMKITTKKSPPMFIYHQVSNDSIYYDLIALVNNKPILKISNKDIDRIEIQKANTITNLLSVFTGDNSEETHFNISFKLNSSFIAQISAIKSDSMSKLFAPVNFYNKVYSVGIDIDKLKKSQEIKLIDIFTEKEIEEIKKQYSNLIEIETE